MEWDGKVIAAERNHPAKETANATLLALYAFAKVQANPNVELLQQWSYLLAGLWIFSQLPNLVQQPQGVNARRIPWRWGGAEGRLKDNVALLL